LNSVATEIWFESPAVHRREVL